MNAEPLWAWMRERESIRLKRAAGQPAPWTDDPILAAYHFCNVNRRHDRVTEWLLEHWMNRVRWEHPQLWWGLCLGRQFNYIPTLAELGFPPDIATWELQERVARRVLAGEKVYNDAYMIHPPRTPGMPKYLHTFNVALGPIRLQRPTFRSVQKFTEWLAEFPEWGLFMAYEVATDLTYTPWLGSAPDAFTWANIGPGARRGLNRLRGVDPRASYPQHAALRDARALLEQCPLAFVRGIRDIEHSLCEFDKYERAREGRAALRRFTPQPRWS